MEAKGKIAQFLEAKWPVSVIIVALLIGYSDLVITDQKHSAKIERLEEQVQELKGTILNKLEKIDDRTQDMQIQMQNKQDRN